MDDDRNLPDATPDRDYDTIAEYPDTLSPADRPKTPSVMPPPGSCDSHVHIFGHPAEYPLAEGRPGDPAPGRGFEEWLELLRTHLDTLGMDRVVIVHSLLYGDDNSITAEAVRRLGDRARGIGLIRDDAGEDALDRLARAGFKGVRLNYVNGGDLSWSRAMTLAPMLAERDMHLQMLLRADEHLPDLAGDIRKLPVPLVIDHIATPNTTAGPDSAGMKTLRDLMAEGCVHVKLSALYRVSEAPWDTTDALVEALVSANPERCLWGSDWPHILLDGAPMPDAGLLLDAFFRVVSDSGARQRILVDNPAALMGF